MSSSEEREALLTGSCRTQTAAGLLSLPDGDRQTDRQTGTRAGGGGAAGEAPPSPTLSAETATFASDRRGRKRKKGETKPKALRNSPLALAALATMWPERLLRAGKRRQSPR